MAVPSAPSGKGHCTSAVFHNCQTKLPRLVLMLDFPDAGHIGLVSAKADVVAALCCSEMEACDLVCA